MTRRSVILAVAIVFGALASPTGAHDEFRVIGTIVKFEKAKLVVKGKDGTASLDVTDKTTITRDRKRVTVAELKAGRTVVVDAYGDSDVDALAITIQIVPATTGTR